jgi:hypothetical protein
LIVKIVLNFLLIIRAQLELTQVRQEIERRLAEKDDEFSTTKKNFAKAIEGISISFLKFVISYKIRYQIIILLYRNAVCSGS